MLELLGVIIHVLPLLAATICHVSGDYKLPGTPKKPELFVFGWPNIISATASMESISVNGTVQYDLFYNLTCPFVYDIDTACSTAVADLIPVDGCERVENQLISSSSTSKVLLSCTICNSTKECARMRISRDHDLCLYLRVNTSFGVAHSCMESSVMNKIIFPPPKNIWLLPTAKKQLTVLWDHPDGIKGPEIKYKVILWDQFGRKCSIIENKAGKRLFNFTNLNPWSNYSVTICGGLLLLSISVNTAACTCGDDYHVPGGPIFARTLPEEPSEHPLLEPCEAFCDDSNFTVTIRWKASKNLIMNGIPKTSEIRIFNSSSPVPVSVFSVPLEPNYNGSLVTLTISNLTSHSRHIAKVQFCSNGGCGPDIEQQLGCDVCESLRVPGTSSATLSQSNNGNWPAIFVGVLSVFVVLVALLCVYINKKKSRPTNRSALKTVIGDLQPGIYEEPDSPDMTSEDADYNSLESLLPPNNNQSERWV